MQKLSAATLSFLLLCPNLALGKTAVQSVEPLNGFIMEDSPEWSDAHLEYHKGNTTHAAYHLEKMGEHGRWHQGTLEMQGEDFGRAHHTMHKRMNRLHRRFHYGQMMGGRAASLIQSNESRMILSKRTARGLVLDTYRIQRMKAENGFKVAPALVQRQPLQRSAVKRPHTPPPSKRSAREAVISRRMAERGSL